MNKTRETFISKNIDNNSKMQYGYFILLVLVFMIIIFGKNHDMSILPYIGLVICMLFSYIVCKVLV